MASAGYPGEYATGAPISEVDRLPHGALAFHAGTAYADGKLVTSGGRVLTVVGQAATVAEARALAYEAASCVGFEGKYYRTDIAGLAG